MIDVVIANTITILGKSEVLRCLKQWRGYLVATTTTLVAQSLVSPKEQKIPVRLVNPGIEQLTIKKNTAIGCLEKLQDFVISPVMESLPDVDIGGNEIPSQSARLQDIVNETGLAGGKRDQLLHVLQRYTDVFAKDRSDVGRTG